MGILGYNDIIQQSAYWVGGTRTVSVDAASGGSTTGTLPASNVLTRNPSQYFEQTLVPFNGSVILNLGLITIYGTSLETRINTMLVGIVGLQAVSVASAGELDVNVQVRASSSSFAAAASSPVVNRNKSFYQKDFFGMQPRQVWTPYGNGTSGVLSGSKDAGGIVPYRYTQIVFTCPAASAGWNLRVGRVCFMTGLQANVERFPEREFADETEVVRAYSGMPYLLKRSPLRQYHGKLNNLTDAQIAGRAAAEPGSAGAVFACLNTINRTTGRAGDVVIIPQIYSETAASGRYSSQWQTEPVFGTLDNNLSARRRDTSAGAGIWESDFKITEIPVSMPSV